MSCPEGFDPFGARDAALFEHAEGCAHCGDVLRVLGVCNTAWKRGLVQDRARAVFRERRLGRARPPARTAMTTLVFAVVVAGLSGYALARRAGPRVETPPEPHRPAAIEAPPPVAPRPLTNDAPLPAPSAEASAEPEPTEPPRAASTKAVTPGDSSRELWERAVELLDAGDRPGAERAFRRVIDLQSAEPGLRSRATFRWAQLLLSRGDKQTPREPLFRLVRGGGDALGYDAALLLERAAPEERARIWDAYLEHATDPKLRERAMQHR